MKDQKALQSLLPRKLIYFDIGARWGLSRSWSDLRSHIKTVSFEPDLEECTRLQAQILPGDQCLPYALFCEEGEVSLHLTRERGCTSIYPPNFRFLSQFPETERLEVQKIEKIRAVTLDQLHREKEICDDPDFLKLDVQGAELDILKGGKELITKHAIGIEVEVEFHELYQGQPLFSDVDSFIRKELGLELQDLRKTYWKYREGIGIGAPKGKLIFGDALYFRPVSELATWSRGLGTTRSKEKVEMAIVTSVAYNYFDYALNLLNQAEILELLGEPRVKSWKMLVQSMGKSIRFWDTGIPKLGRALHALFRLFQPSLNGWGTQDDYLGSRKRLGWFW